MGHLILTDGLVKATVMIICLALVQSATFIGKFGKKHFKNVIPGMLGWWWPLCSDLQVL